jgi:hypothetical protein
MGGVPAEARRSEERATKDGGMKRHSRRTRYDGGRAPEEIVPW